MHTAEEDMNVGYA